MQYTRGFGGIGDNAGYLDCRLLVGKLTASEYGTTPYEKGMFGYIGPLTMLPAVFDVGFTARGETQFTNWVSRTQAAFRPIGSWGHDIAPPPPRRDDHHLRQVQPGSASPYGASPQGASP